MPRPKKKQTRPAASASAPPSARMLDLIIGYWVSQLVHVAAKLQLADLLKDGPKSCAELAARTGTEPHRLYRLLRALASVGVFAERKAGRFALTPLATTLRSDRPDSMRDFALMMVERYNWDPWSRLLDGVSGEEVPFHAVHGMNAFEYLAKHPDDGVIFGRSMTSLSRTENPAVEAAYDFSRLGTLVDVGGSHGHLLAAILQKNRRLRGILFDQPHVLEQAKRAPYVSGSAVKERIKMMPGDFFISVPEGADAYIMKYILHDWDDDACVTILKHCRQSMAIGGRVLVVDTVIPPGNRRHWGKLLDINMLVATGGRERTKEEFGAIFQAAGLKIRRIHPTACPLSIVEGVSAS
ncbi:MAG TPA: methyltransferase [Patescibacteria group bacterium]|nr:methyltransferase [Patescibacteria group bacterium]